MRIAVAQHEVVPGQVNRNLAKALALGAEALAGGADVILFPEEMTLGYTPRVHELAEPLNGPTTRAFTNLLARSDAVAICGITEREGLHCYITAAVVGAAGVIASYRKTHLWWNATGLRHEPTFYMPGDSLVVFEHHGARCGLMICYDGDFPEMTRAYANLGCSVLFWLNNRGSRGHEETRPLAARDSIILAASCCCGNDEAGNACSGGSHVTDHDGKLIAEVWNREGVVFADVDPAAAIKARALNPWHHGQRPGLYRSIPPGSP